MEKIKKNKSSFKRENYLILRLFKEDIEEIIDIFTSNFNNVGIELDEYRISNASEIEEIRKEKEKTYHFRIGANENGPIYLNLSKKENILFIADKDNLELLGIFHKLDDILSKRVPQTLEALDSYWVPCIFALAILGSIIYMISFPQHVITLFGITMGLGFLITISLVLIFVCIFVIILYYTFKKAIIIYLFHSDLNRGFFGRNKDQLFWSLFSAAIGLVGGFLIGK